MIRLKRIYETPQRDDGYRVLIDRLWPRGLSRRGARIDAWFRDIAPSAALRQWFAHDPAKWAVFRRRYLAELKLHPEHILEIKWLEKKHGEVTLLFAAKDMQHNHAAVVSSLLAKRRDGKPPRHRKRRLHSC